MAIPKLAELLPGEKKPKGKRRFSDRQEALIVEEYRKCLNMAEVARKFECSTFAIVCAMRRQGEQSRGYACRENPSVRHDYFSKIDTKEKAYILGLLATDGSIRKSKVRLSLAEEDRAHVEWFLETISPGAKVTVYKPKQFKDKGKAYQSQCQVEAIVFSLHIVRDLTAIGIHQNKTHTVKPWSGPDELLPAYWLGCMDGDGSLFHARENRAGSWRIGFCGNQYMVNGFTDFLRGRLGIEPGSIQTVRTTLVVTYRRLAAVKGIVGLLYDSETPCLPRKREKAELIASYVERYGPRTSRTYVTREQLLSARGQVSNWAEVYRLLGIPLGSGQALRRRHGLA